MPLGQGPVTTCATPCTFQASALEAGRDHRKQVPHAKKGNTSHSGRSKVQRETLDHHGSHFPGSGTNVGRYKQLSTQRPGSPQEHDSTPRRLSSVYPRQATHVLFTKKGPVESECKLNNVNPHFTRNQYQNSKSKRSYFK